MEQQILQRLTFLMRCFGKATALADGRCIHVYMITCSYDRCMLLCNCLVGMYGKCGSMEDAQVVFDTLSNPNLYSWNILLNAYCQNGYLDAARAVFNKIPQPDLWSWNMLIKVNSQLGNVDDASDVFHRMPYRNVASWNAMISTFVWKGHFDRALDFFYQMQVECLNPDNITFVCALDACTSLRSLRDGRKMHVIIINIGFEQDILVGTALVNMYGKVGRVDDAQTVFVRIPDPDAVSWTAAIAAFSQNGRNKEALGLFQEMQLKGVIPDKIAFVCAINACGSLAALNQGKKMDALLADIKYERDLFVGTALVNMYGRSGSLHDAKSIFRRMHSHDAISWTAMIGVLAENGQGKEALSLFQQMQLEGIKPDKIAFVCTLDACASLGALEKGQEIHIAIVDNGFEQDVVVGNSIVNMYGKCGSLCEAKRAFDRMPLRSILSWNTMIGAFALNGSGNAALDLLYKMQVEGIRPGDVTFLCILTACSHTGQVEDGKHFFVSMNRDHHVAYTKDHYVCMIDLLGRAGQLHEAEELIDVMPLAKFPMVWKCLLGACRTQGDVERGVRAANRCFELDQNDAAPLVMLLNIYAAAGRWDAVPEVRDLLGLVG